MEADLRNILIKASQQKYLGLESNNLLSCLKRGHINQKFRAAQNARPTLVALSKGPADKTFKCLVCFFVHAPQKLF